MLIKIEAAYRMKALFYVHSIRSKFSMVHKADSWQMKCNMASAGSEKNSANRVVDSASPLHLAVRYLQVDYEIRKRSRATTRHSGNDRRHALSLDNSFTMVR